jgi:outer membrane receptor protein involved in Fe transport
MSRRTPAWVVAFVTGLGPAAAAQDPGAGSGEPSEPAAPQEEPPMAATEPVGEAEGPADASEVPVSGWFGLRYQWRHAPGANDQDVYGLLNLDVGDPDTQPFSAHLLTRGTYDLDGHQRHTGAYAFDSLADSYGGRASGQVYEAFVDWNVRGAVDFVRAGRQITYEAPVETYFDGVRVDTSPTGDASVKVGAYGGVPSHLYESSPRGDLIVGAFGEALPWLGARARLDWMQVEDDFLSSSHENALVRLALWQQLGETVDLYGNWTMLDWEGRDFELRGSWRRPESDLRVQLDWYQLLTAQSAQSIEFDPYFPIVGDYNPYRQVRATASKGFGEHFDLTAGADVRRLEHEHDEGTFNRDFERWYLEPILIDWPVQGMTVSVTGEIWDADDTAIATYGANLTQVIDEELRLRLGTVYSLYKYDFLSGDERDHVRTYYAGVDWKPSRPLRVRLDYSHEIDAFTHYDTIQVAATWTF